ncbi:MAG: hypothetical protein R2729_18915 [Bryobacteraceae bacterium]
METYKIDSTSNASERTPTNWKTWAAGGVVAALVAANGFLFVRGSSMESEMAKMKNTSAVEMNELKQSHDTYVAQSQRSIEELNQQLAQANAQSQKAAAAATQQARLNADRVAKKAEELVNTLAQENKLAQARVDDALTAVREAHDATNTKVGEVETQVGTVRTEVDRAKAELEATIADLRSVRGDLGVQSGLIATNAKELAALRDLGERNYHEFAITKKSGRVKVGSIAMQLKKADTKRNKFNLEVVADDKRVEKKDKTINEPVQFYVSGARQPYEIVVNEVTKDKIVGYLAVPKVMSARR